MSTWLNYHHLHYFWVTAREGSLSRAANKLRLSPSGLSMQVSQLERSLGHKLFERVGRGLVLTPHGRLALRYADEIFGLGKEMTLAMEGHGAAQPVVRLSVGVGRSVPRLFALELMRPALDESSELVVTEDTPRRLLKAIRAHELDLALLDAPMDTGGSPPLFNHLLGKCDVAIYGAPELARSLRKGFPRSLDGARFVWPAPECTLAASLRRWFEELDVQPRAVATVDDPALMKSLGELGYGVFASHEATAAAVTRQYRVERIGGAAITERVYAVTLERRIRHPAVAALVHGARAVLARAP